MRDGCEEEFDAFGFPFGSIGERFTALEDALAALSALQSGETANLRGPDRRRCATRRCCPAPVNGHIPVWVGGKGGPRLLRLIAAHADGWNVVWRVDPEDYAGARERPPARRSRRRGAIRPRSVSRWGSTRYVAEDEAAAEAAFERGRARFPGGAMDADTWQTWRADTLSGTPEQAIERIRRFEELGVEEIVISPSVLPFAVDDPEMVDLLAERVMAPLRSAS